MMRLLHVLRDKKTLTPPPFWMMRQAGRYLPEYRKVRQNFDDFISFCLTPDAVTEVTLQPLRRFPLDAAIIFSDILVIPHALGQKVWFETHHGPKLESIDIKDILQNSHSIHLKDVLSPITQGIQQTRTQLPADKALIGFSGAPWTLATYMVSQGKTADFRTVLDFAQKNPVIFQDLLTLLTRRVIELLSLHIDAGVNVVQIFESWAGAVPPDRRDAYLYTPLRAIVASIQERYPTIPMIYYGRGVNADYPMLSDLNIAFGIDEHHNILQSRNLLPHHVLQGNLSPSTLQTGENLETEVEAIQTAIEGHPFIFNLGHGIHKDTPIHHVERMIHALKI